MTARNLKKVSYAGTSFSIGDDNVVRFSSDMTPVHDVEDKAVADHITRKVKSKTGCAQR